MIVSKNCASVPPVTFNFLLLSDFPVWTMPHIYGHYSFHMINFSLKICTIPNCGASFFAINGWNKQILMCIGALEADSWTGSGSVVCFSVITGDGLLDVDLELLVRLLHNLIMLYVGVAVGLVFNVYESMFRVFWGLTFCC